MSERDERKQYDEESRLRLVATEPTRVQAVIHLPSGCMVEMRTRGDGIPTWVDQFCKRATTPEFANAGHAFIDETVWAWHEHEPIPDVYDHKRSMLAADALVKDLEEKLRKARADRLAKMRRAKDSREWKITEIADLLGYNRNTVGQMLKEGNGDG